jgi:hypothetical protein
MMLKVAGVAISGISLLGGFYAWDVSQREEAHVIILEETEEIRVASVQSDRELQLQTIELEIGLLQDRREREGQLSPDDQDRLNYLLKLREILREAQYTGV